MKFFYVHPDDARWLRRWLMSNLVCFVAIVGFVLILRFAESDPLETMKRVRAEHSEVDARGQLPVESDSRSSSAIAPDGWRRTAQGWEHVSAWPPIPRSLGEIIMTQREREPVWIQFTLATVRRVPPLAFGMLQIAAIAFIVNVKRENGPAALAS